MITFKFESAYMGESDYTVFGDGEKYRLTWRWGQSTDYERSIFNGTPEEFEAQVVAKVGGCHARYTERFKPEVYYAFCTFVARELGPSVLPPRPLTWSQETKGWRLADWFAKGLVSTGADCAECDAAGRLCPDHAAAWQEQEAEAAADRKRERERI